MEGWAENELKRSSGRGSRRGWCRVCALQSTCGYGGGLGETLWYSIPHRSLVVVSVQREVPADVVDGRKHDATSKVGSLGQAAEQLLYLEGPSHPPLDV